MPRSRPAPLPEWQPTHPRLVKIGNTSFANETLVGSGAGGPSVTVASATVTCAAPIGSVSIVTVTDAFTAWPSVTVPAGTLKNTTQAVLDETVAVDACIVASRNCGPLVPAITRFEPAMFGLGWPSGVNKCNSRMPFVESVVTPKPVTSAVR